MFALGIETSCDETAAAVVENCTRIRSNVVTSSLALHKRFGGIIPEIAFRRQSETICEVTDEALRESGCRLTDVSLISVTEKPGLLGSLLVGISFAKALALAAHKPLVGINHLHGHIYSCFLEYPALEKKFPFVALVVSGGHTSLFFVKNFAMIEELGSTRDDACGEAFDKVAKILGLGYPGGPVIERLAAKAKGAGIPFHCANAAQPLDFSFSGIKTAVLYYAQKHGITGTAHGAGVRRRSELTAAICRGFQSSVINTLFDKTLFACGKVQTKRVLVAGGVAANTALRAYFSEQSAKHGIECYFPHRSLCTDNAAMIAGLGSRLFKRGQRSALDLSPVLD